MMERIHRLGQVHKGDSFALVGSDADLILEGMSLLSVADMDICVWIDSGHAEVCLPAILQILTH